MQEIINILTKWGEKLVNDMKAAIDAKVSHPGGQTSDLSGGVNYKVLNSGGKITFQLTMPKYWEFADKGVDGTNNTQGSKFKFKDDKKRIPITPLLKFVKQANLKIEISKSKTKQAASLKNSKIKKAVKKQNREDQIKSTTFALSISIKRKGIKGKHFYNDVINEERIKELKTLLIPVLKKQMLLEIKSAA